MTDWPLRCLSTLRLTVSDQQLVASGAYNHNEVVGATFSGGTSKVPLYVELLQPHVLLALMDLQRPIQYYSRRELMNMGRAAWCTLIMQLLREGAPLEDDGVQVLCTMVHGVPHVAARCAWGDGALNSPPTSQCSPYEMLQPCLFKPL